MGSLENFSWEQLLLAALAFWNVVVTVVFIRVLFRYRRLAAGLGEKSIDKTLAKITAGQEKTTEELDRVAKQVVDLQKEGQGHFDRVEVLRFNPFAEMGGNQSFTMALLNQGNSGIIMTGLHSREAMRLYVKKIKKGKPAEGKLSKEEETVVKKCEKNPEK